MDPPKSPLTDVDFTSPMRRSKKKLRKSTDLTNDISDILVPMNPIHSSLPDEFHTPIQVMELPDAPKNSESLDALSVPGPSRNKLMSSPVTVKIESKQSQKVFKEEDVASEDIVPPKAEYNLSNLDISGAPPMSKSKMAMSPKVSKTREVHVDVLEPTKKSNKVNINHDVSDDNADVNSEIVVPKVSYDLSKIDLNGPPPASKTKMAMSPIAKPISRSDSMLNNDEMKVLEPSKKSKPSKVSKPDLVAENIDDEPIPPKVSYNLAHMDLSGAPPPPKVRMAVSPVLGVSKSVEIESEPAKPIKPKPVLGSRKTVETKTLKIEEPPADDIPPKASYNFTDFNDSVPPVSKSKMANSPVLKSSAPDDEPPRTVGAYTMGL